MFCHHPIKSSGFSPLTAVSMLVLLGCGSELVRWLCCSEHVSYYYVGSAVFSFITVKELYSLPGLCRLR